MNLKKLERYLRVNLLGPGPRLMKKRIYRAAVSQRLRNTAVGHTVRYGQSDPAFKSPFLLLHQLSYILTEEVWCQPVNKELNKSKPTV